MNKFDNDQLRSESIAEHAAREFERAARLALEIEPAVYRETANGTGSVGGHFRHNLDLAVCFLKGLSEGRIDYTARKRDTRVETDREYASSRLRRIGRELAMLDARSRTGSVLVRSEVEPDIWLRSSVDRELEFLHSHTVHHHAMITEKLANFGVAVEAGFGVAPSTLEYWRTKKDAMPPVARAGFRAADTHSVLESL